MSVLSLSRTHLHLCSVALVMLFWGVGFAAPKNEQDLPAAPKPGLMGKETPGLFKQMLEGPLKDVEEIVFAMRGSSREWHFFASTGYDCADPTKEYWSTGPGALMAMNLHTGDVRIIMDDPKGAVRYPCVSYDGKKIVFSYRPGDEKVYHLYEINADGSGLKQLTFGEFDDVEPIYVPDGGIVFVSARCKRYVPCFRSQVQMLYRCEADGSDIRPLSAGQENELTPWMLPDGRVVYMRWEYVERQVRTYHHLWAIRPDGTNEVAYFGNNSNSYVSVPGGVVITDAKPIPGTEKVVAISEEKHGAREYSGAVVVIDPTEGPDNWDNIKYITSTGKSKQADSQPWRDPYAFSADCFMLANEDGLYVMDSQGNYEKFYDGPAMLHEPRPLQSRPKEPVMPSTVDMSKTTAKCVISNVTRGRAMEGVKPEDVKKVMLIEVLPKPISVSGTLTRFKGNGSNLKRIIGTVPVEPDGSAYFEAPAMRAYMFVLLDENDRAIKRMRSFTTFMPGETVSCIGCHESRTLTEQPEDALALAALKRPPSQIEKPVGMPPYGIVDYMRDLQPVLDKHCVKCHTPTSGNGDLTGGASPDSIHGYQKLSRMTPLGGNVIGNDPPYKYGSGNSKLLDMLRDGHGKVKLSEAEFNLFRLWIDSGMWQEGTHAAMIDKRFAGFAASDNPKGMEQYAATLDADILQRRCDSCHTPEKSKKYGLRRKKVIDTDNLDLNDIEQSLLLLAPLSKEAGGLGKCKDEKTPAVFADKEDPDYIALKGEIEKIRDVCYPGGFHWQPGFRPLEMYYREMKRYGVLAPDVDSSTPLDPFEVDQKYYELFYPETQ